MGEQHHTRETIIQLLQNIAAQIGGSALSKKDVQAHLPLSAVNYHFGRLSNALNAAGLVANKPGPPDTIPLREDELFESIAEVERQIGYVPSLSDYRANGGRFSNRPFNKRFGAWDSVLQHYRKWRVEHHGDDVPILEASCFVPTNVQLPDSPAAFVEPGAQSVRPSKPPQLFGEPIDFRGLRHAQINEQGVVYLFGMVSRELGFSVEALQQGFPDCEGSTFTTRIANFGRKLRIEFEFRASNFRDHCHDETNRDVIVCWEKDWPNCPLRVVELKSEIMCLPSR